MSFKVLCCGDRNWANYERIKSFLELLPLGTVVIEGECKGADLLSKQAAIELGFPYKEFPAEWKKYGKKAGPIRNQQMLDEGQPNVVVAFHNDLPASKGTLDMVTRAVKAGVYVMLVTDHSAVHVTEETL